ncbi:hypothetical protein ACFOSD_04005 [Salinispirillum marinum]|uniref:DUF4034 domain-containing protein n=2 Tax=Saccharospirillaceae TaxID=255527 RepID=A0ABV8BDN6_9GAMM
MAQYRLIFLLLLGALCGLLAASWLARQTPNQTAMPSIAPPLTSGAVPEIEQPVAPASLMDENDGALTAEPPSLPTYLTNNTDATPAQALPLQPDDLNWLDPYFGLETPEDRAAVDAVLGLSTNFDFTQFWQVIGPLAEQGNAFAHFLALAYREWLPLDDQLLRLAFVEEPYLQQRRPMLGSPNWLHWLYAQWPALETPSLQVRQTVVERALTNDLAAQTLLVSQPRWFVDIRGLQENRQALQQQLSQNPYIQLFMLLELAAQQNPMHEHLQQPLQQSRHPLVFWASQQLEDPPPPAQNRATLLALAQQGYLMALQEVRHLVVDGQGRWTTAELTPVTLNDALAVYQQQATEQPGNPVLSVALCELYLKQGDYQASWQYLQQFAYEDDYADEVEDISCWHGNDDAYGELMVQRGVLTADAWQAHVDIINARRARIRSGER